MPIGTDPTGLDDATLLQYAQQAGVVPGSSAPMPSPGEAGAADPSQFSAPAAPAPAPSQDISTTAKVGLATSGYSTAAANRVNKQGDPGLNKSLADADSAAQAAYSKDIPVLTAANTENKAAAGTEAKAQAQLDLSGGREARILADLQTNMGADEAKINEHYRAESNQSKADYMAALTDLRGSRVDPSALWKQMGPGNQFGMLVSAFVQDFLGVRGIHVSAMDTFNKAVERNIDAQVQAIKTKGDVAEGFKSLWYMQRSQASSDAEARTRVRGFLLDGAKQAVVAHMAQYKSALSDAQGQAAIAKLDDAFSKNLVEVYHHIDQSAITRREQAIQIYGEKLKASMEQQRLNFERDRLKGQQAVNPQEDLIIDPETHKAAWQFRPGIDKELKNKLLGDKLPAATDVVAQYDNLLQIVRRAKPTFDGIAGTRLADTDQQEMDAAAKRLANSLTRATDGRVAEYEVNQLMAGLRQPTTFNRGEAEKLINNSRKISLNRIKADVEQVAVDLPADDARRNIKGGGGVFAAADTETKNIETPPEPTARDTQVTTADTELRSPKDRDLRPEESNAEVEKEAANFAQKYPQAAEKQQIVPGAPTSHEHAMVQLRDQVREGGEEGNKALVHLMRVARGYTSGVGGADADPDSIFATMLLFDLHDSMPDTVPDPTAGSARFKNP